MVSKTLGLIDISKTDKETASELLEAAKSQGFFYIDGHDFFQEEVDQLFEMSEKFFKLDVEEKLKFPTAPDSCGYTACNQELLDTSNGYGRGDPKELFTIGRFNFLTGESAQGEIPEAFKNKLLPNSVKKLYKLSTTILRLLAIALEIDESKGGSEWFVSRHQPTTKQISAIRFLHYPANKEHDPETAVRCGAHTDYGSITFLFQRKNEEGLQLYSDKKQAWESVKYIESNNKKYISEKKAAPILVNIADQLSYWTGGLLKSTKHRVVLPQDERDRYSIGLFIGADDDVLLEPIPSFLISNEDRPKKLITSREYITSKFEATYLK